MLVRFTHSRYSLRFRSPINTAHGPWLVREGLLLRIQVESGATAFGEIAPIPWFGTCSVEEAERFLNSLSGEFNAALISAFPPAFACVRAGFEAALEGVQTGGENGYASEWIKPMEGDSPLPAIQLARKHAQVAALLPAGKAALQRVRALAELDFRCFKWKVGVGDLADELVLLDDLLGLLPSGARLRLDANGAWDRRKAERCLSVCADRPIEFVEQPIAPEVRGSEDLLLGLANDFPTPLALDESLVHEADIRRWLELGWNGFYVLKPALLGGVRESLAALARAKASVVFSSALETRIGALRLLRLAFEWPGEGHALGCGVWPLFEDARFDGPHTTPFVTLKDLHQLNEDETWNASNGPS